jgi:hypothetical protein
MKRNLAIVSLTLLVSSLAPAAGALEWALDRAPITASDWNADIACPIQYWNGCVGWTWTWTGWSPGDRIGVHYSDCSGAFLTGVDIFTRFTNGVPVLPGYGFTATLETYLADAQSCPTGPPIASVAFLPDGTTQTISFPLPRDYYSGFVALVTMGPGGSGTARYGSDFDAQGPTGPQGCGTCFPTSRVSRSYYYGTAASPLCPGSKLSVICEVEWRWTARMFYSISVEETSWGQIKSLYQ